jgi:hypothetical protein
MTRPIVHAFGIAIDRLLGENVALERLRLSSFRSNAGFDVPAERA